MKRERIVFELSVIFDRLNEIRPDYESNKSIRQEHITDIKISKYRPFVVIHLNTYAFRIMRNKDDDGYEINWYHKVGEDKYVKDGSSYAKDLAAVIRDMEAYLYGGFCPSRSKWWVDHPKPKRYTKNQRWP